MFGNIFRPRRLVLGMILLLGSLLIPLASAQAAPFLATFRTTAPSESITLPLVTGYTYNFTVDWGDATATSDITTFDDADRVHTYATAGDYQISITGDMQMWNFFTVLASKDQIISLDDAGDVGFGVGVTSFYMMFNGASNLTSVALFDTSSGTTFQNMFIYASSLTSIPLFDTSSGTVFQNMFRDNTSLTTIPLLDTTSGTDFSYMFHGASSLTLIPLLNTSAGTNFSNMFYGTSSLASVPLLNTSNGTSFNAMFSNASGLTTIPAFNTSSGISFINMFYGASSLTNIPLLDTSAGTDFTSMFNGATSLATIPLLDVSGGTDFYRILYGTSSLTEGALIGARYDIDYNSTNMAAPAIRDVLANIGTADGVQTLTLTGNPGLATLTADDYTDVLAKGWTVVPEPPVSAPFLATLNIATNGDSITLPLYQGYTYDFTVDWGDGTSTSDITIFDDVDRVHTYTTAGDYQISVTGQMQMWNFFRTPASRNQFISLDDVGDVGFGTGVIDFGGMFSNASNLTNIASFDVSSGTSFVSMFNGTSSLTSIPLLDTSSGTNFSNMFYGASSLASVPLLNTSAGTSFESMFRGATNMSSLPLFDTSSGTNFSTMFYGISNLATIPLFDTSLGTDFSDMFQNSTGLTAIPLLDTSAGINFRNMFSGVGTLTTIPLLDTSSGTNFSGMFWNAGDLTVIPLLDTSAGTNFSNMFNSAHSLTTVPLLNVSSGINFSNIFTNTTALTDGALNGTRYAIDYSSTSMAAPAIQDVFTNIGTADGAQTLNITNNPGVGNLTEGDYAVALGKGWTVVPEFSGPASTCTPYTSTYFTLLNHYTGIDFSAIVSALNGHFYYNCDSREFQYGDATSDFITPPSVGEKIGTAASITLINTNQTAELDKAYFDSDNAQFKLGQSDGTLLDLTPPARQLDAAGISGVTNAEEGQFYFNTTSGEFYIGNGGGTLSVLFTVGG